MLRRTYGLYVSTYKQAQTALQHGDEQRLRSLCSEVACLGGLASTVSMMALSDAECGRRQRSKSNVIGIYWRTPKGRKTDAAMPRAEGVVSQPPEVQAA